MLLFSVVAISAEVSFGAGVAFYDDFESYAVGQSFITATNGWQASSTAAYVTNGVGYANSKALAMGASVVVTNTVTAAPNLKIWTDFQFMPTIGLQPAVPQTNTSSFLAYANTNGYLVVAVAGGGWYVCSNQLDKVTPTLITSNGYTRISVCQDFSTNTFAVFVAGNLVAQGLSFPANTNTYSSLLIDNPDYSSCLDTVRITTDIPPGMTSDLDGNGIRDALEIHLVGRTGVMKSGTLLMLQ
jgi:hypothetical protein